ncbi:MAG: DUF4407 domain-containing protein [Flavobacteriales bacterium]|nr:DUF4407 domain-containing protein [Flavobacteriales bacterium]
MLKQFFILCSGSDTAILENCSKGEQNKYAGIGATVFFTAVMAFVAASYALYTVFDNWFTAVAFGLVWALLIFNLDRFIVSTIKKRDSFVKELIQASPRLILAIIIAIVIAKPLELKIFEKEINQVLLEEKNTLTQNNQNQIAAQYAPEIKGLQQKIKTNQTEITNKEAEVNSLYNTYITEAEGTKGSLKLGKGPVYKEKREKHDALLKELQLLKTDNKTKIDASEAKISLLKGEYKTKVGNTQPIIDNYDGLMARVNALNKLPWLPSFFIFLLFLAIETSPILAKLLAPKGEYDFRFEEAEMTVENRVLQKENEFNKLLKADAAIQNRVYDDIAEEDELYNYKKQKAQDLIQLRTDSFFNFHKKGL